jgi:hypothetical protein
VSSNGAIDLFFTRAYLWKGFLRASKSSQLRCTVFDLDMETFLSLLEEQSEVTVGRLDDRYREYQASSKRHFTVPQECLLKSSTTQPKAKKARLRSEVHSGLRKREK